MNNNPMKILINGQHYELCEITEKNIHQALKLYLNKNQHQETFAVALNGDFVDKESYRHTKLTTNDSIDVLFPIQGG